MVGGGCGVQEPISLTAPNICAVLHRLSDIPKKGSVVVPAHITQHPEQQSRLKDLHVEHFRQIMLLCCPEQH